MAMHNNITPPSPSVVNLEVYVCRKGHCLYPRFERFYYNTAIPTAFPLVATLVSIVDTWYLLIQHSLNQKEEQLFYSC